MQGDPGPPVTGANRRAQRVGTPGPVDTPAAEPRLRIVDNPEKRRYEAILGDRVVGFAEYRPVTGRRIFTHTEVDPAFEGRGYGSRIARAALDDVRAHGLKATVHCPFINEFVEQHRGYDEIILRRRWRR
jgi:predicted GNAT family acetyltransferase